MSPWTREITRDRLRDEGIDFQERGDGYQFVVIGGQNCVIDFWPRTGKWFERGSRFHGKGLGRLIRLVRHRDRQMESRIAL